MQAEFDHNSLIQDQKIQAKAKAKAYLAYKTLLGGVSSGFGGNVAPAFA